MGGKRHVQESIYTDAICKEEKSDEIFNQSLILIYHLFALLYLHHIFAT